MTHKLQIIVDDSWLNFDRQLTEAYRESLPEDQRAKAPRSTNPLIPLGLLLVAEKIGRTDLVTPERLSDAKAISQRRPGPRKIARETLPLFDDGPGKWLSVVDLDSGTARVQVGEHRLSLFGCHVMSSASAKATSEGWGVFPETCGGVAGLRFVPPGTDIHTVAAPEPMAPAEVGVWISESMVAKTHMLVTTDGRVVKQRSDEEREAMFRCGTRPEHAISVQKGTRLGDIAAYAFDEGWTARSEHRGGHPGILLIPPHVSLTYEVAPGRRVAVS